MSTAQYRSDIDGLRAITILAVVGFRAFPDWIKGGFVGVDIFFVISGFLISIIVFDGLKNSTFSFIKFHSRCIKQGKCPALKNLNALCRDDNHLRASYAKHRATFVDLIINNAKI